MRSLDAAFQAVHQAWPDANPMAALILGSGWGAVTEAFEIQDEIAYDKIPELGGAGVAGHRGRLLRAEAQGRPILIFQGRRHWYEGVGWEPVAVPVYLAARLGACAMILTNAAGGMDSAFQPGDFMAIEDHVNLMGAHPLIGPHDPFWGPRFPDQSKLYDPDLRTRLLAAGQACGESLHTGIYLALSGPTYETPAEIRAFRNLGASAVGMSTVPEAILANAAGMKVVGLSCITNLAAGLSPHPLSHEEVTQLSRKIMPRMRNLLSLFMKELKP